MSPGIVQYANNCTKCSIIQYQQLVLSSEIPETCKGTLAMSKD